MPKKATQSGAESVEVKESGSPRHFAHVPAMIAEMAKGVSIDMNKHQIQASIMNRLENWAKKQGLEDEWMVEMPKHVKLIREVSDERFAKAERFKEHNRLERQKLLARSELNAQ